MGVQAARHCEIAWRAEASFRSSLAVKERSWTIRVNSCHERALTVRLDCSSTNERRKACHLRAAFFVTQLVRCHCRVKEEHDRQWKHQPDHCFSGNLKGSSPGGTSSTPAVLLACALSGLTCGSDQQNLRPITRSRSAFFCLLLMRKSTSVDQR